MVGGGGVEGTSHKVQQPCLATEVAVMFTDFIQETVSNRTLGSCQQRNLFNNLLSLCSVYTELSKKLATFGCQLWCNLDLRKTNLGGTKALSILYFI